MKLVNTSADVLVVGGGTAGTIAAIQSARAGAKTVLVERGTQLGGVTTTGGVSFPGLFHAWGRQVIAGIGWDLVEAAALAEDRELPDFTVVPDRHWHHQVRINGQVYAAMLEEACVNAGVQLCYYEIPVAIEPTASGWQVDVVGKGIRRRVVCKQVIDATGGADLAGLAGIDRMREAEAQPGTLIFKFGNYDVNALDKDDIQRRYEIAMRDGLLQPGDKSNKNSPFVGFLRSGGENAQHVFDADSSTSVTQTDANIRGRQSMLRLLRFIRTLPGCEKARLEQCQQETAVRETYRIVGETVVTRDDYLGGRVFDDAVCFAFYPIDIHNREGIKKVLLDEGVVPTVPLSALTPKESRNILVAGRSVSSDRAANSALRVQACSMAMGQAAGAAASLAVELDTTPLELPLAKLHERLRQYGAIVP